MDAHIWIDGVIHEEYHKDVKRQLAANPDADTIVLHIQSPGGSVYAGYNTYHLLKSSGKRIKTIIEGEAQSMATFIALAGDEIEIRNPSVFMIHNPSSGVEGDADMMINGASELRNIENDMALAYSLRTKIPVEKIKEMMKKTTVLNAVDAQRMGFVDRVIDPLKMVAIGKKINMEEKEIDTESMFTKLLDGMNSLVDSFKAPKAEAPPIQEKGIEQAPVQEPIKAASLPEGEYPLQDGRVIVIDEAGMIIEVKEVMPEPAPEPEPMPEEKKDDKADMLASIQAQLDTLKASMAAAMEEKNKAVQALGVAKEEVEQMKKKTVGDESAPAAGAKFDRTPVSAIATDTDKEMQKEIFNKLGLSHLIK